MQCLRRVITFGIVSFAPGVRIQLTSTEYRLSHLVGVLFFFSHAHLIAIIVGRR